MKILIIGSTGMIGTSIERICKERKIPYISLSHNKFEITNRNSIINSLDKYKPDILINCVALIGKSICDNNRSEAWNVNAFSLFDLAILCKNRDIILVHISTSAVFDGHENEFLMESSKPNPISLYGRTKWIGEEIVKAHCDKYYIFRLPMTYGPRRNDRYSVIDKLMDWMKNKDEIRIANDKIESFSYSYDTSNLLTDIISEEKEYGIYHLSNDGHTNLYNFSKLLAELMEYDIRIIKGKCRDFNRLPEMHILLSEKISPIRKWDEALREYVKEIKKEL